MWVLLVTWVVHGQPPSSYQTTFTSQETCEAARQQVLQSAFQMKQEMWKEAGTSAPLQMNATVNYPHVSAVCSAQ
jgi:hypothetical protein